jgi:hypothetical protein
MSDYLAAYSVFICKPAVVQDCVAHMIVPPIIIEKSVDFSIIEPSEQLRVLQGLFSYIDFLTFYLNVKCC